MLLHSSTYHCFSGLILHVCRWMQMESSPSDPPSPAPSFVHSHSSVPHWLLPTGKTLTCVGVETFSTDRHLTPPCYKGLAISFRDLFKPMATSLQQIFSLPHGTGCLDVFRVLAWYVSMCKSWVTTIHEYCILYKCLCNKNCISDFTFVLCRKTHCRWWW